MTFEDLSPLTRNPRIMAASMAAIDGLAEADRIGVDELTPSFRRAAASFASAAQVVVAGDLMAGVRRHKLPGEVEAIARACEAAWIGVAPRSMLPSLPIRLRLPSRRGRGGAGRDRPFVRRWGRAPGHGDRCRRGGHLRPVRGGVGGWFADDQRAGFVALADACRAGASHADLAAADWLVRGLGMGFERPVIGPQIGSGETLEAGMVLSVADGPRQDVVHVTDADPEVLSERP